ncbi:hypothetical protein GH714_012737 [Hevea brasiliensis]|uniref:Uncharacterized protein n=1 Tax=Hevea brasiliensis TaxID=3981 RepID=A0A6A6L7F3_HEVBR|nr:hypothetical protein GH714_012737 [Hevea brasiliensis]
MDTEDRVLLLIGSKIETLDFLGVKVGVEDMGLVLVGRRTYFSLALRFTFFFATVLKLVFWADCIIGGEGGCVKAWESGGAYENSGGGGGFDIDEGDLEVGSVIKMGLRRE